MPGVPLARKLARLDVELLTLPEDDHRARHDRHELAADKYSRVAAFGPALRHYQAQLQVCDSPPEPARPSSRHTARRRPHLVHLLGRLSYSALSIRIPPQKYALMIFKAKGPLFVDIYVE